MNKKPIINNSISYNTKNLICASKIGYNVEGTLQNE